MTNLANRDPVYSAFLVAWASAHADENAPRDIRDYFDLMDEKNRNRISGLLRGMQCNGSHKRMIILLSLLKNGDLRLADFDIAVEQLRMEEKEDEHEEK